MNELKLINNVKNMQKLLDDEHMSLLTLSNLYRDLARSTFKLIDIIENIPDIFYLITINQYEEVEDGKNNLCQTTRYLLSDKEKAEEKFIQFIDEYSEEVLEAEQISNYLGNFDGYWSDDYNEISLEHLELNND